jgi:hypothetical protein
MALNKSQLCKGLSKGFIYNKNTFDGEKIKKIKTY